MEELDAFAAELGRLFRDDTPRCSQICLEALARAASVHNKTGIPYTGSVNTFNGQFPPTAFRAIPVNVLQDT